MTTSKQHDYPLDKVHRWPDWCALVGIHPATGWRLVKAGKGPIITKLTAKRIGVRHRNHLAWLAAREPHQDDAAA
jgi:predicted DNA-binding transcriptional regulator AlpA